MAFDHYVILSCSIVIPYSQITKHCVICYDVSYMQTHHTKLLNVALRITFYYLGLQCFVLRPVEHPLNYRRAPTIQISSSASQQDRHLYGENRLVTL